MLNLKKTKEFSASTEPVEVIMVSFVDASLVSFFLIFEVTFTFSTKLNIKLVNVELKENEEFSAYTEPVEVCFQTWFHL